MGCPLMLILLILLLVLNAVVTAIVTLLSLDSKAPAQRRYGLALAAVLLLNTLVFLTVYVSYAHGSLIQH
ncbi:hypothetical protein [Spirosoma sp. 209]|uniref:hypothetical protein n=1 Tax=Spirosoma sp. 209 TaxID=1955701 RepID=UPI001116BA8F|nr:hypothetical protein [Spirosoma sp. 209]